MFVVYLCVGGISPTVGLELLSNKIASGSEVLIRWLSHLPKKPTLLFIESFAYDGRVSEGKNRPPPLISTSESRPKLSHASCYHVNKRGYSVSDTRKTLLEVYGINSISLKRALWPSVNCPFPIQYESQYWQCSDTCHHPSVKTHILLSKWITQYIVALVANDDACCALDKENEEYMKSLPFVTSFASDIQVERGKT